MINRAKTSSKNFKNVVEFPKYVEVVIHELYLTILVQVMTQISVAYCSITWNPIYYVPTNGQLRFNIFHIWPSSLS